MTRWCTSPATSTTAPRSTRTRRYPPTMAISRRTGSIEILPRVSVRARGRWQSEEWLYVRREPAMVALKLKSDNGESLNDLAHRECRDSAKYISVETAISVRTNEYVSIIYKTKKLLLSMIIVWSVLGKEDLEAKIYRITR